MLDVFIKPVEAVCPLCTVAVAGGLEISRMLGVDDLISAIWIGGLTVSLAFWLADYFSKKNWLLPFWREVVSLIIFYLLVIPYLFWSKAIGKIGNTFLGFDKIILGIVIGSLAFFLGVFFDHFLRKINGGKIIFYYQKVIIPVFFLALVSLIFYQLI